MVEGKGEKDMLKHQTGRGPSSGKIILKGIGTAVSGAFLSAAILAKLVDMETIRMESIGYGVFIAHFICVFLGTKVSMTGAGKDCTAAAGLTAGAYYLILLLVNFLFFGGSLTGLGSTLALVALASVAAIMTTGKQGRGRSRKRYKIPR
jgi:hypothetical protein